MPRQSLTALLAEIHHCRVCAPHLPLGPRPVLRASTTARLLVCGQAPGTRVHQTGLPFNDPSGDRLRLWLGLDRAGFYDERRVAIVPMGFCYPGRDPRGGDRPPRAECAPLWLPRLAPHLAAVELTLPVGQYAQAWYLGRRAKANLTQTVMAWREYLPDFLPLPHPSWRNTGWLRRNPWFERELVPFLRARVAELVGGGERR
jgi:uracil-DNA glycosylase